MKIFTILFNVYNIYILLLSTLYLYTFKIIRLNCSLFCFFFEKVDHLKILNLFIVQQKKLGLVIQILVVLLVILLFKN